MAAAWKTPNAMSGDKGQPEISTLVYSSAIDIKAHAFRKRSLAQVGQNEEGATELAA